MRTANHRLVALVVRASSRRRRRAPSRADRVAIWCFSPTTSRLLDGSVELGLRMSPRRYSCRDLDVLDQLATSCALASLRPSWLRVALLLWPDNRSPRWVRGVRRYPRPLPRLPSVPSSSRGPGPRRAGGAGCRHSGGARASMCSPRTATGWWRPHVDAAITCTSAPVSTRAPDEHRAPACRAHESADLLEGFDLAPERVAAHRDVDPSRLLVVLAFEDPSASRSSRADRSRETARSRVTSGPAAEVRTACPSCRLAAWDTRASMTSTCAARTARGCSGGLQPGVLRDVPLTARNRWWGRAHARIVRPVCPPFAAPF